MHKHKPDHAVKWLAEEPERLRKTGDYAMSMITDVLNLGRKEASMICSAYPEWILLKIASINSVAARYRLFVPSEDVREDDYFLFLLKNRLALASVNFRLRLKEDRKFRERVRKVVSGL